MGGWLDVRRGNVESALKCSVSGKPFEARKEMYATA